MDTKWIRFSFCPQASSQAPSRYQIAKHQCNGEKTRIVAHVVVIYKLEQTNKRLTVSIDHGRVIALCEVNHNQTMVGAI